jgi:uncharacterized membrane protein
MGNGGRAAVAVAVVLSVVLMVIGYRSASFVPVYTPLPGMGHANNMLMLVSIFLFGVGGTKGTLYPRMRHPMLWGIVVWAVAHLLVNGDLASVVLFGGLGLGGLIQMAVINRRSLDAPCRRAWHQGRSDEPGRNAGALRSDRLDSHPGWATIPSWGPTDETVPIPQR